MSKLAISIAVALIPGAAAAHPGHAAGGNLGAVHFVTDPFHVALTVAAVLVSLAVGWSLLRSRVMSRSTR